MLQNIGFLTKTPVSYVALTQTSAPKARMGIAQSASPTKVQQPTFGSCQAAEDLKSVFDPAIQRLQTFSPTTVTSVKVPLSGPMGARIGDYLKVLQLRENHGGFQLNFTETPNGLFREVDYQIRMNGPVERLVNVLTTIRDDFVNHETSP